MSDSDEPATSPQGPSLLILEQSSHLDWDWWETFYQYYEKGPGGPNQASVKEIYDTAISYVLQQPGYPYVFCEMGYLRQYLSDYPEQAAVIRQHSESFSISSGGITSADNLLSHGEAFIRNYLCGRQWAVEALGITTSHQLWIPDDFGQDAQLPIVLQAMGFRGVAFERIPAQAQAPSGTICCVKALDTAASEYLANEIGPDFVWKAADGSSAFAHWLSDGYCAGNNAWPNIDGMIPQNIQIPYVFVPIDCDFSCPEQNLLSKTFRQYKGVMALAGTFDQFMNLVQEWNLSDPLPVLPDPAHGHPKFIPNPYYSGAYISHPDLKQMHYEATRLLLGAEAFELILEHLAFAQPGRWSAVAADARARLGLSWDDLVPSTHHDYITGTAVDPVYSSEQQPRLAAALENARALRREIVTRVAGTVTPPAGSGTPVVVFNPLGFQRSGLVEMRPPLGAAKWTSAGGGAVQYAHDGALLFEVEDVPSLGYATIYLNTDQPQPSARQMDLTENPDGTVTLTNEYLCAQIGPKGINSLKDLQTTPPTELFQSDGVGNSLIVYVDEGNIYRLGNEIYCDDSQPCSSQPSYRQFCRDSSCVYLPDGGGIRVLEDGTLRKMIRVSGTLEGKAFVMDYSLLVGEPFLRMKTTGTAPDPVPNGCNGDSPKCVGHSIMVSFPLAGAPTQVTNGTPYHWDTNLPRQFFDVTSQADTEMMNFEATHQFVIPEAVQGTQGRPLAAIYHVGTPAWGLSTQYGDLLGCILRNTPGGGNAAWGSDYGEHAAEYAIRVPTGLQSPTTGAAGPLGEALGYTNPLIGALATGASPVLPSSMSIAAVDAPALITVAKAGTVDPSSMILRLYQPTNAPLAAGITIDHTIASRYRSGDAVGAKVVTALETTPLQPATVTTTGNTIQFTASFALTSLQLGGSQTNP